jgi:hypothetical protein
MLRGLYNFGFCGRCGLEFGGLGNRFDGSGGNRLGFWHGCRLLRNNFTLSLRGGRSPLLYWYRPIDTSIHVRCGSWLRFWHGRRNGFFNFSGIRWSNVDGFLGSLIWRDLCILL